MFNTTSSQEIFFYIDQLDLDFIAIKMSSKEYLLPQWGLEHARQLIPVYKRFLKLLYQYPHEKLIPTKEITELWQNHILYTMHYHQVCQIIFGKYYHYQPLNPDSSVAVKSKIISRYQMTKSLYFKEYNETM